MQGELCRCCGKQPALTAEMLQQLSKIASPGRFVITNEMRRGLPPNVLEELENSGRLEQVQEWTPARQNQVPAGVRVGLCAMCSGEGCDGIAPCRVPSEHWLGIEQGIDQYVAMQRVLDEADDIERRWLAGELGQNSQDQETGEWLQITAAYWRSHMRSARGPVIGEAIHDARHDQWLARVKFAEESPPAIAGNVAVSRSAGATILNLESLQEAQAVCEQMVAELSVNGPFTVTDISTGFGTVRHDE